MSDDLEKVRNATALISEIDDREHSQDTVATVEDTLDQLDKLHEALQRKEEW